MERRMSDLEINVKMQQLEDRAKRAFKIAMSNIEKMTLMLMRHQTDIGALKKIFGVLVSVEVLRRPDLIAILKRAAPEVFFVANLRLQPKAELSAVEAEIFERLVLAAADLKAAWEREEFKQWHKP